MITMIAAIDDKRGIALRQMIPWDIPQDRSYFKKKTIGHKVVMGYKTYESIKKPLIDRHNIVLTSNKKLRNGFVSMSSVDEVMNLTRDIYIIGGQQVYEAFIQCADLIILTRVLGDFGCDRFFPEYKANFSKIYKSRRYKSGDQIFWYESWARNS